MKNLLIFGGACVAIALMGNYLKMDIGSFWLNVGIDYVEGIEGKSPELTYQPPDKKNNRDRER